MDLPYWESFNMANKNSTQLATLAEQRANDTVKKAAEEQKAIDAAERAGTVAENAVVRAENAAVATMEAIEATQVVATEEITEADDTHQAAEEIIFAAKRVKEDALNSMAAAKAAQIAVTQARATTPKK